MKIVFEKEAAKQISKMDKTSKTRIKQAIFQVLVRFVPEDKPLPDEVEAIARANRSIAENGTMAYDTINWN